MVVSGNISGNSGAGLTIRNNNNNTTLTGSGSTTQLSGSDTYTGNTFIIAGTLQLGGANANVLPTATQLVFGNGAVAMLPTQFDLNGVNQQVAGIGLTGLQTGPYTTINNSSATAATLNVSTATGTPSSFAGMIIGNLALTKTGSDVLNLTGSNSYSGGTSVSAGTLLANSTDTVNGSTGSGLVSVASGGILGGGVGAMAGVVKGGITVNSGGHLTAGAGIASATVAAAPGILNANFGTTTLSTGANLDIKVNNVTGSAGTNWDEVLLIALNVSSGVNVNLYGLSSSTNMLGGVSNFNSTTPFMITIADVSGVTPATLTSEIPDFTINTSNFTSNNTTSLGSSFSLVAAADLGSGSFLELQYNATPEPGTAILVLGGVAPMLMARRRSRAKKPQCPGGKEE